jgi:hypothetical protein
MHTRWRREAAVRNNKETPVLYDHHSALLLAKQLHDDLVRETRYRAPLFRNLGRRNAADLPLDEKPAVRGIRGYQAS